MGKMNRVRRINKVDQIYAGLFDKVISPLFYPLSYDVQIWKRYMIGWVTWLISGFLDKIESSLVRIVIVNYMLIFIICMYVCMSYICFWVFIGPSPQIIHINISLHLIWMIQKPERPNEVDFDFVLTTSMNK